VIGVAVATAAAAAAAAATASVPDQIIQMSLTGDSSAMTRSRASSNSTDFCKK
jgi:hypothetical protein